MKILVVTNRRQDQQYSMDQYADLLTKIYQSENSFEVKCVQSPFLFSNILKNNKIASYLDKFVLMPFKLLVESYKFDVVHIVDHSNAFLAPFVIGKKLIITCHDMIAIRSAFDKKDICLSQFGKLLQRACLWGLKKADKVVCVSNTTQLEYRKYSNVMNSEVILSCLNSDFKHLGKGYLKENFPSMLSKFSDKPFLFHVGSNLERKNREGIIKAYAESKFSEYGLLVFAGEPLNESLIDLVKSHKLSKKVISLGRISFEELNGLYSSCEMFVFPSFSEGFGWPVIEAQASGAPTICSNKESLKEVGDIGTFLVDPTSIKEITTAIDVISSDNSVRKKLIVEGKLNLERFKPTEMKTKSIRLIKEIMH